MNNFRTGAFFCLIFLLIGCSPIIKYNYDKGVDFSEIKAFDWVPVSADPDITEEIIEFIQNEVNVQFTAKGFEMSSDSPDFLVAASIGKETRYRVSDSGATYRPHQLEQVSYSKGSLLLILLDARSKAMIWWGEASVEFSKRTNQEKKEKKARKAVKNLFKEFPPGIEE